MIISLTVLNNFHSTAKTYVPQGDLIHIPKGDKTVLKILPNHRGHNCKNSFIYQTWKAYLLYEKQCLQTG